MVSAFVSRLSGPSSSPGDIVLCSCARHFTLAHSASHHPDVQMGTSELYAGGNLVMD